MNITETNNGREQTLVIRGEIDLYNSPDLGKMLQKTVDGEIRAVYVNLQDVTYMDSSGLGVLISAANRLLRKSGQLFLVRPSVQVLRLLEMTRLLTFFRIVFDSQGREGAGGNTSAA